MRRRKDFKKASIILVDFQHTIMYTGKKSVFEKKPSLRNTLRKTFKTEDGLRQINTDRQNTKTQAKNLRKKFLPENIRKIPKTLKKSANKIKIGWGNSKLNKIPQNWRERPQKSSQINQTVYEASLCFLTSGPRYLLCG